MRSYKIFITTLFLSTSTQRFKKSTFN